MIGLDLVDPRYYHLDTALCVLDDTADEIMYYPPAFSPGSRAVLSRLFPDALIAEEPDAAALGLNAVSDGHHVLLPQGAVGLFDPLRARGYEPIAHGPGRAAQGRRQREVLHAGTAFLTTRAGSAGWGGQASPHSASRAARYRAPCRLLTVSRRSCSSAVHRSSSTCPLRIWGRRMTRAGAGSRGEPGGGDVAELLVLVRQ